MVTPRLKQRSDAVWILVVRKRRISAALLQCSPTCVRRLLFAHHPVAVAIPCAGYHRLRESPAAALAALHAGFAGGLCRVARAVGSCRGRRSWVVRAVCRAWVNWRAAMRYLQFRRVCACVEHSAERISFAQGDGETPIIFARLSAFSSGVGEGIYKSVVQGDREFLRVEVSDR